MAGCHPSHRIHVFTQPEVYGYDAACIKCGRTDQPFHGWGQLAYPCPVVDPEPDEALRRSCHMEDEPTAQEND